MLLLDDGQLIIIGRKLYISNKNNNDNNNNFQKQSIINYSLHIPLEIFNEHITSPYTKEWKVEAHAQGHLVDMHWSQVQPMIHQWPSVGKHRGHDVSSLVCLWTDQTDV